MSQAKSKSNKVQEVAPQVPQGFTAKEAAHILSITGKSLRRMIRKGRLEAVKFSGRWYISPETLAEFKAAREKAAEEKEEAATETAE
jgi:excisionase family DNA binding protein